MHWLPVEAMAPLLKGCSPERHVVTVLVAQAEDHLQQHMHPRA